MPGWRLASAGPVVTITSFVQDQGFEMKIDSGPSLDELRRKFLGTGSPSPQADFIDAGHNARGQDVTAVRIEPIGGGGAKTADIVGGRVTIVQG